jgi:biopolymer transport protein ExbD
MSTKPTTLDVWVVETNTVYKAVPYTVVTDWAQQGRLIGEDRVRPAGSGQWMPVSELAAIETFIPKPDEFRAEDQAEALEPVEVEVAWRHPRGEEDDDVDMIPLIDISLVLLIFFMMTATVGGLGSIFQTPQAEHHLVEIDPKMYWVGIQDGAPGPDGKARYTYSLGQGETGEPTKFPDQDSPAAVMRALGELLAKEPKASQVRIRADKHLPCELIIHTMSLELSKLKGTGPGRISKVYTEVSQKENP